MPVTRSPVCVPALLQDADTENAFSVCSTKYRANSAQKIELLMVGTSQEVCYLKRSIIPFHIYNLSVFVLLQ